MAYADWDAIKKLLEHSQTIRTSFLDSTSKKNYFRAKNHLFIKEDWYIDLNNSTGGAVVKYRTSILNIFKFLFKNNAQKLPKYLKIIWDDKIFSLRINLLKFVNKNLVETKSNSEFNSNYTNVGMIRTFQFYTFKSIFYCLLLMWIWMRVNLSNNVYFL